MPERISAQDLNVTAPDKLLRVDIRKYPDERQIPGSVRYDAAGLEDGSNVPFAPDQPVALYCGSGNSCSRIAAVLRERGYDAVAIEGGYAAWVDARLETEPRED